MDTSAILPRKSYHDPITALDCLSVFDYARGLLCRPPINAGTSCDIGKAEEMSALLASRPPDKDRVECLRPIMTEPLRLFVEYGFASRAASDVVEVAAHFMEHPAPAFSLALTLLEGRQGYYKNLFCGRQGVLPVEPEVGGFTIWVQVHASMAMLRARIASALKAQMWNELILPAGEAELPEREVVPGEWLARAMLHVRDHPEWSDARIAQMVHRSGSTLSRSEEYRAAASLARGKPQRPKAYEQSADEEDAIDANLDAEMATQQTTQRKNARKA